MTTTTTTTILEQAHRRLVSEQQTNTRTHGPTDAVALRIAMDAFKNESRGQANETADESPPKIVILDVIIGAVAVAA